MVNENNISNESLKEQLLSEYEALDNLDESNDSKISVLLEKNLIDDYSFLLDGLGSLENSAFKDSDLDDGEAKVKVLTHER